MICPFLERYHHHHHPPPSPPAILNSHPQPLQPPAQTLALMTHTLTSLLSASNPQILELRILTLHHSDERFSFLKTGGRYRKAWERLKRDEGVGTEVEAKKPAGSGSGSRGSGLGGLMGAYADSDSDDDEESAKDGEDVPPIPDAPPPPSPPRDPPPLPLP
jgi:hypothetical protein